MTSAPASEQSIDGEKDRLQNMTRSYLLTSLLAIQNTIVWGQSRILARQASALRSWLNTAMIVGALSVCVAPCLAGQTWNGFSAAASPAVSWPEGAAVGDFDNSGNLGFATCDTYGDVYVFLGNGNGTFTAAAPTSTPYCSNLVAGDFNGDGKLDLAVNDYNNYTVTILLGNGNGTFTQSASIALGANNEPTALAVGDFNNDGKLDLAVGVTVGSPSDLVKIFLGNGNGTFTAGPTLTLGAYQPYGIAVGNFTGNGNLDLAVTAYGSSNVTVFLGDGNGTFSSGVQYATGGEPWGIVTGDFNNDGKPDLAIANFGSNTVTVLLGNGNGTFTAAASPATGKGPRGITAADFNGNGNLDLAVVNETSSTVSILLGNGNGTFTAASQTPATGSSAMAIGTGDWNGDGFPDLVVANYSSSTMTVLLNQGPFPTTTTLAASPNPVTYGETLTLTATIAHHGLGDPSLGGTVTFYSDGTPIGSASVSSNVATLTTTALTAGTHSLTAEYAGTTSYNASTSSAITQTVNQAVLTVEANNVSKVYGTANPALTASYSGFMNGDTSAVLSGSPSLTTTATAASPTGSYTITAAAGTLSAANYSFVFVNGTLTITKATSSLSITSTINPSTYGQSVTFTLKVAGSGSGLTPTGTVTFTEGGTTLLGTTTLSASGTATYTTSALPAGANTLTLNYSGDTNYF
jgi:hypothetical protein